MNDSRLDRILTIIAIGVAILVVILIIDASGIV